MRFLAALFALGACASAFAAITLAWPGTALDAAWALNPAGHEGLRALGPVAIAGMAALSGTMVILTFGLLTLRRWAWWIAIIGLVINATGDLLTAVTTGTLPSLIGVPIAGAIVWWLTQPTVRARFR